MRYIWRVVFVLLKFCPKCKKELPATNKYFGNEAGKKDGLKCYCKECRKEMSRKYKQENTEIIRQKDRDYAQNNKDKIAEYKKQWKKENIEKIIAQRKEYRQKNANEIRVKQKEYYNKNRENLLEYQARHYQNNCDSRKKQASEYRKLNYNKIRKYQNEWEKNKRLTDAKFSINSRISRAITRGLQFGKEGNSWRDLVDFTLDELINHIERLFLPGMSWENRSEWHIDHIKPIASFNFTTCHDIEFKQAWSLTNLQPLWKEENLLKRDKWYPSQRYENGDIQMALII